jgi:hypothetical protein
MGLRVSADLCCPELGPRLDGKALWLTARFTDVSATTKHVRSALRMRDVDRNPAMAGDFPTIHLSAITGGKK